ncbi:MAG: hypothetical protein ACK5U7_10855 [Bacteroidota bacterium]
MKTRAGLLTLAAVCLFSSCNKKVDEGKTPFKVFAGKDAVVIDLYATSALGSSGRLLLVSEQQQNGGGLRELRILGPSLAVEAERGFAWQEEKHRISGGYAMPDGHIWLYEVLAGPGSQALSARWIRLDESLQVKDTLPAVRDALEIIREPRLFMNADGSFYATGMGWNDNRLTLLRYGSTGKAETTKKLPSGPVFDQFYRFNVNRFAFLNPLLQDVSMNSYDTALNLVWIKNFGGGGRDRMNYMENHFGAFQYGLAAKGDASNTEADIWVMKFNMVCDTIRTTITGGPGKDIPGTILQTLDSGMVVTYFSERGGPSLNQVVVTRYDKMLKLKWSRNFGGFGLGRQSKLIPANANSYYLVYDDNSFAGGEGGSEMVVSLIGDDGAVLRKQLLRPEPVFHR